MASPSTAVTPPGTHQFAWPWTHPITVAAGNRQRVNFLNVTRSLKVRCSSTDALVGVAFGGPDSAHSADVVSPVTDGDPYNEQVQVPGIWLVNGSASSVTFNVDAVLGPDASATWPVYTKENGYDAVSEAPTLPAAVAI